MRGFYSIFTVLVLIRVLPLHAQIQDSIAKTLPLDTMQNAVSVDTIVQPASSFGLDHEVEYFGKDSTVVDILNQRIMMYGQAWVKYDGMEVKGDFIAFNMGDYTATAIGKRDSLGNVIEKAVFAESNNQFEEDSLMYNFKTKRGISYGVRTEQMGAFLLSGVSKKAANNWISVRGGMFTTCDKPNPHYHFHLTKAMAIPDDKIVSGPLYLKFRKIPTPLALPFGFFPNKRESTHGILLPGYGNGATKGYFLQNLGYYIPISPYLDTKFLFDVYTRGSWSVSNVTRYKKLYKYNGNFDISRTINVDGMPEVPSGYSKSSNFNITWNHNQDPKARPNTSFRASVNLGSSQNFRNNLNSSQTNYLSSTFASQVAWSKDFIDTPFNLGINLGHSQNTQTRMVDVTLPSVAVNMKRITLGKWLPNDVALKKILDNVGLNASANLSNRVTAHESMFNFSRIDGLNQRSKSGLQIQGGLSSSGTVFKRITVTGSMNGSYIGSFKRVNEKFVEGAAPIQDTTFGYIDAFNYGVSGDLNFRIYGMFSFRKGNVRAIRHVLMPRAGMSYTPYTNYRNSYINSNGQLVTYSPFDVAAYVPQSNREGFNANFSLRQNFEAKVRDKSSTKANATKKVMLLDNWNMSTAYNLMADSLRWSGLTISASTALLNKFNISYNSNYSFYGQDKTGREINTALLQTTGKLMRMRATSLALNFSLKSKEKSSTAGKKDSFAQEEHDLLAESKGSLVDLSVPWNLTLSYSTNFSNVFNQTQGKDSLVIRQGILFNGSISFFKYWAITFNSGYDMSALRKNNIGLREFGTRYMTPTTLGLTWDLHCWEFTASYVPFGQRKSYMFQLNIKSSLLQDLKLQRRGNLGDKDLLY